MGFPFGLTDTTFWGIFQCCLSYCPTKRAELLGFGSLVWIHRCTRQFRFDTGEFKTVCLFVTEFPANGRYKTIRRPANEVTYEKTNSTIRCTYLFASAFLLEDGR